MRKRKPVLLNGEALMADGKTLEFDAVDQGELDGKIDAPQTAQVGEVLTVEEVDADGKPIKWKAAPAAAEQAQADWYELDVSSKGYLKNKPIRYRLSENIAINNIGEYRIESSLNIGDAYVFEIGDNKSDLIVVEDSEYTNLQSYFDSYGIKIKNVALNRFYLNAPVGLKIKAYKIIVDSPLSVASISEETQRISNEKYRGIFSAKSFSGITVPESCGYVYYNGNNQNELLFYKDISVEDSFDFGTVEFEQYHLSYFKEIGECGTELGLEKEDAPLTVWMQKIDMGGYNYFVETAKGEKFSADWYPSNGKKLKNIKDYSHNTGGFVITVTVNEDTGNLISDKTYDEIKAAYDSGSIIRMFFATEGLWYEMAAFTNQIFRFVGIDNLGILNFIEVESDVILWMDFYSLSAIPELLDNKIFEAEESGLLRSKIRNTPNGLFVWGVGEPLDSAPSSMTVPFPLSDTGEFLYGRILKVGIDGPEWKKNQGLWHLDTLDDIVDAEPLTMYQYGNSYRDSGFAMKFIAYPNNRIPVIIFDANWLRFRIRYINNSTGKLEEESNSEGSIIGMPFTIPKRPASAQNAVYGENNGGYLYTDSYTTSETDVKLSDKLPSPPTAQVGQIVKVKSVDESGKITETETVDMLSVSNDYELVFQETISEDIASYTRDTDKDGNPFSLTDAMVIMFTKPFAESTNNAGRAIGFLPTARWGHDTVCNISGALPSGQNLNGRYDLLNVSVINGKQVVTVSYGSQNSTNVFGTMMLQTSAGSSGIQFYTNVDKLMEFSNPQGNITCVKIVGHSTPLVSKGTIIALYKKKGT